MRGDDIRHVQGDEELEARVELCCCSVRTGDLAGFPGERADVKSKAIATGIKERYERGALDVIGGRRYLHSAGLGELDVGNPVSLGVGVGVADDVASCPILRISSQDDKRVV